MSLTIEFQLLIISLDDCLCTGVIDLDESSSDSDEDRDSKPEGNDTQVQEDSEAGLKKVSLSVHFESSAPVIHEICSLYVPVRTYHEM